MGFTVITEERGAWRKKVMKKEMDPGLKINIHICTPDWYIQERLGVLAATCAARQCLPLRTSTICRRLLFFIARLYSR